jgi:hypothetical protein
MARRLGQQLSAFRAETILELDTAEDWRFIMN